MRIDFEYLKANIEKKQYRLIGSGSGRFVFDLDNGYVVKVAKNRRGVIQNKAEYQIASTERSHVFAKIVEVSEDFHYLIMEKAEKLKSFSEVWSYYQVNNNRELFRTDVFRDILQKHNLLSVDLCRISSWGMIKNKPVIIDFGFTREVKRYYSFFW